MAKKLQASGVVKRSIVFDGRKTSISLEDEFWEGLKEAAASTGDTLSSLVAAINRKRQNENLSSCLRLYVLEFYRGGF
jgi:predicted DNA-binding ribbon-helix-helix protein